jgi:hypothetical protein
VNKGFCILAQNNSKTDYIRQAYALATSIHKFNKNQKVSIITNDDVPEKYKSVFDQIIPIPFLDDASDTDWKIENRWKVYHASPYEQTIVMDADMLVLENIEHWWSELSKRELFFVSNVRTYRGDVVTSRFYRKVFDSNNLPNLYSGIYYFQKGDTAYEFFKFLELVMTNWELFYGKYAGVNYQRWCSVDVSCALVSKLLDNSKEITQSNSFITFTHMKPHVQDWKQVPEKWTKVIGSYFTNQKQLLLGNFTQSGVLHYVEDEFLTDKLLSRLEAA